MNIFERAKDNENVLGYISQSVAQDALEELKVLKDKLEAARSYIELTSECKDNYHVQMVYNGLIK